MNSRTALEGHLTGLSKPFPGAGSAMRAAGPTTRAAFPRLELLDHPLEPAGARRFLFGRDDPTNPFVSRQRRQILPSRLRRGPRAQGHAHISRDFVQGSALSAQRIGLTLEESFSHCHHETQIWIMCEAESLLSDAPLSIWVDGMRISEVTCRNVRLGTPPQRRATGS